MHRDFPSINYEAYCNYRDGNFTNWQRKRCNTSKEKPKTLSFIGYSLMHEQTAVKIKKQLIGINKNLLFTFLISRNNSKTFEADAQFAILIVKHFSAI